MIPKMRNKNLEKFHRPIKFYQIQKNVKRMILMDLKDRKWEDSQVLIFQMPIAYFKDFLEPLHLITKMIKIFLAGLWEEEIKMEKEVLGSDQCLMMISLALDLEKWEECHLGQNLDLREKSHS